MNATPSDRFVSNKTNYLEWMLKRKENMKILDSVQFDSIKICCPTIQLKGHRIINNEFEQVSVANNEHRKVHWGHSRAEIFDRFIIVIDPF